MKNILSKLKYSIKLLRFLPHIILYYGHKNKKVLDIEKETWIRLIKHEENYSFHNFIWLLHTLPEYRSVLYWRLGKISCILKLFASGQTSFQNNMDNNNVDSGLVIQHGYSTIIDALHIGKECQIWHNVTIGTSKSNSFNKPTIKDNVKICAGAIVIGNIVIGNNVTVGAGAVVTKSVPDNCTVVGNPARIVKVNSDKVNLIL